MPDSGSELATRAACLGELRNPRLSRSSAEYPEASWGSLHESASSAPPSGLAMSTPYPRWVNSQYVRQLGPPETDRPSDLLGHRRVRRQDQDSFCGGVLVGHVACSERTLRR